jgi:hypothetical protein
MDDFHIRTLTAEDDLDAFGRLVLASNLALPDMRVGSNLGFCVSTNARFTDSC